MDMPGDRYFQPEIETMPRAQLAKLQTERILSLLAERDAEAAAASLRRASEVSVICTHLYI
jgi:hypothetical protein